MAEQTVELSPAESKQVSFEAIPHEAKTYQVSVNGLSGSFKALPSIDITGFHYVYQGLYTWSLTKTMLHGYYIDHIGFGLRNNGAYSVDGVSVKCKIINQSSYGGYRPDQELSPPLDQYKTPRTQPFTIASGETILMFYRWKPGVNLITSATVTAKVLVNGELIATRSLDFTISYD